MSDKKYIRIEKWRKSTKKAIINIMKFRGMEINKKNFLRIRNQCIAIDVLCGFSFDSEAMSHNLSKERIRQIVFTQCRKANPIMYNQLEVVNIEELRKKCELFLYDV